ncbi:MAG: hypothetical protein OEY18_02590 [Candidatus Aminicenantes bacterium]|nr:hypothetical protein [Candidatus Aminicenantes bacterium]MDH5383571.1 hypothetical protein [Candidatus Aminicenantes bacterium]
MSIRPKEIRPSLLRGVFVWIISAQPKEATFRSRALFIPERVGGIGPCGFQVLGRNSQTICPGADVGDEQQPGLY